MLNFFATWRRQAGAVRDLSRLSDRDLDDLGIVRADIGAVVTAATVDEATARSRLAATAGAADRVDMLAPSWGTHNRRCLVA